MKKELSVVCFGEVLWDHLPKGKRIGGAPLNVALRMSSYGIPTTMISRIGDDQEGQGIKEYMLRHQLQSVLQVDSELETGKVVVDLDKNGDAKYTILKPVAWDNIGYSKSIEKAIKNSEIFIFGSLICRSEVSKATLIKCLESANCSVFDVNLRNPVIDIEILKTLMCKSDFLKFNESELFYISQELGFDDKVISNCIKFISEISGCKEICVTRGGKGVVLFIENKFYHNSGFKVNIRDTVGAGDSFLATLLKELKTGKPPMQALDFASAVGSLVASKEGANSQIEYTEIQKLMWVD